MNGIIGGVVYLGSTVEYNVIVERTFKQLFFPIEHGLYSGKVEKCIFKMWYIIPKLGRKLDSESQFYSWEEPTNIKVKEGNSRIDVNSCV